MSEKLAETSDVEEQVCINVRMCVWETVSQMRICNDLSFRVFLFSQHGCLAIV